MRPFEPAAALVPLMSEYYFLVCLADTLEHPAVVLLRQVLGSAAWHQGVAELPGYTADRGGEVLSLTRALPWWHFKTSKQRTA